MDASAFASTKEGKHGPSSRSRPWGLAGVTSNLGQTSYRLEAVDRQLLLRKRFKTVLVAAQSRARSVNPAFRGGRVAPPNQDRNYFLPPRSMEFSVPVARSLSSNPSEAW
jgi:hypothetical protein